MQFSPEAQILILNGVILGVAYLGIFPSLEHKKINRIMTIDLVLSALAIFVAGALFWGTGTQFSLMLFTTNWAIFTVVTFVLIEAPLFVHFARKYGVRLFEDDDG
jgi:hypothetical protein